MAAHVFAKGVTQTGQLAEATELSDMLSGRIVEFRDGLKSTYTADRSYTYSDADGEPPFVGANTAGMTSGVASHSRLARPAAITT